MEFLPVSMLEGLSFQGRSRSWKGFEDMLLEVIFMSLRTVETSCV
jgi:hypothetical protein